MIKEDSDESSEGSDGDPCGDNLDKAALEQIQTDIVVIKDDF